MLHEWNFRGSRSGRKRQDCSHGRPHGAPTAPATVADSGVARLTRPSRRVEHVIASPSTALRAGTSGTSGIRRVEQPVEGLLSAPIHRTADPAREALLALALEPDHEAQVRTVDRRRHDLELGHLRSAPHAAVAIAVLDRAAEPFAGYGTGHATPTCKRDARVSTAGHAYNNTTPPWGPGGVGTPLHRVCIGGASVVCTPSARLGTRGNPGPVPKLTSASGKQIPRRRLGSSRRDSTRACATHRLAATGRRELGIRAALGARPAQLVSLVGRQGLALTALGFALEIPGMLALTRLLSSQLYGVTPMTR
jgi:hypothetical protein